MNVAKLHTCLCNALVFQVSRQVARFGELGIKISKISVDFYEYCEKICQNFRTFLMGLALSDMPKNVVTF